MIQPAFVNTEITEIISFKEDFQMKKQEKNGKRSASVFGRFCSAIALCTIIVTLAATALPIIALSVRRISDRPAAGAADEGSNIYSAERDGAVFRLHILANSDSTEDQRVKLAVRDAVIEYEREQTGAADAFDAADAESILRAHGDGILQTVRRTLKKCGAEYDAQLAVGKFGFPEKQYGETVYPAGEYRALRILLGEARGKNWWCLMFPPLCIADLNGATIDDKGSEAGGSVPGGADAAQNEHAEESRETVEPAAGAQACQTDGKVHFRSLIAEFWHSLFG